MVTAIEKAILQKLYDAKIIGEKHTSEDNIPKGFAKHERGDVKKALKKLIKQGYINQRIKPYGIIVSLNPRKMEEIKKLLQI